MIPKLGPDGAATLQRELTEHVVGRLGELRRIRPIEVFIWYSGGSKKYMQDWLGASFLYHEQTGNSLGERMIRAFEHSFVGSTPCAQRTILIGSDCPGISESVLASGFEKLRTNDIVLGPAMDGGYYLIGLDQKSITKASPLFDRSLDWGKPSLYNQTRQLAEMLDLTCAILPTLHDIDIPADLIHWQKAQD